MSTRKSADRFERSLHVRATQGLWTGVVHRQAGQRLKSAQVPPMLHSIVLQIIFELLFPPPGFLKVSNYDFSLNSPWMRQLRMKKALTLVCRGWHEAALPYLYKEVCIRYVGQLPALVRTIRANPKTFAPLVRSLRIICYVPDNFVKPTADCISILLTICPSLHKIAFEEGLAARRTFQLLWGIPDRPGILYDAAMDREFFGLFPKALTELAFFDECSGDGRAPNNDVPVAVPMIRLLPNLVKLSINGLNLAAYSLGAVSLPALDDLTLYVDELQALLPDHWELPLLTQFRVRRRVLDYGNDRPQFGFSKCPNRTDFLEEHGEDLCHVDIGFEKIGWADVSNVVDLCPNLDHFVFTLPKGRPLHALEAQSIAFIDLFETDLPENWDTRQGYIRIDHLGSLREAWCNIRLLDHSLLHSIPDLPVLLPPTEIIPGGELNPRIHDIYGARIVQTEKAIYFSNLDADTVYKLAQDKFSPYLHLDPDVSDDSGSESEDTEFDESDVDAALDDEVQQLQQEAEEWERGIAEDDEGNVDREAFLSAQVREEEVLERFAQTLLLHAPQQLMICGVYSEL